MPTPDHEPVGLLEPPDKSYEPYIEAALAAAMQRTDRNMEPRVYRVGREPEDYTGELREHVVVDVVYHTAGYRALYGFDRDDPDTIGLWQD